MPRSFTHSWRGERAFVREVELREFLKVPWEVDSLVALLGPVPGALLDAARDRDLLPCMNFDGAHVHLEICRRTVEYVGPNNLIAITDHIELGSMAGERLHQVEDSSLWYREDDVVAAGSLGIEAQIRNMRSIGIADADIAMLTSDNPRRALAAATQDGTYRMDKGAGVD
jgi:N-acetylglucosamine-6-phosphate deacetylase